MEEISNFIDASYLDLKTKVTNIKERYNNMNIDQFNRSFVSKTRITKNNTFIIILQKYKTN